MFAITERLLLRPGWTEDAPRLTDAIGDPAIARNLARVPSPYALDDALAFLSLPAEPTRPHFLICLREDGRLVGGIGLHGSREAELGYWLVRDRWGQGIATEAGAAVLAIADVSLRLPPITASHALDNPASGRVLAKLGFRPAGEGRLRSIGRDADMDVRLMARERPVSRAQTALAA